MFKPRPRIKSLHVDANRYRLAPQGYSNDPRHLFDYTYNADDPTKLNHTVLSVEWVQKLVVDHDNCVNSSIVGGE